MRKLLSDIREGSFAQEWIEQMDAGEPRLRELREKAADEQIEQVGSELRERRCTGRCRRPDPA